MAEFVEYRMERALPEYEQMQILNLFSAEEILCVKFEIYFSPPIQFIKEEKHHRILII